MISQTKTRFNNILMSILIFNTYIVAASAIYRLNLYIWAYGFTWLRVISQGFIILQAIILAIVLFHVWRRKTNFNVVIVSVYLIGYLVLNYANVDGFIVKGNLDRALKDYDFDGYYHNDLSYDSVDALFDFYINDEIDNASVKKEVLTILRYKHEGLKVESKNWKYFNLAKLNAEKQLSDLFQGNEPNGGIVTEN